MKNKPSIKQIIKENKERSKRFLGYRIEKVIDPSTGVEREVKHYDLYNPYTGKGSSVPRKEFKLLSTMKGVLYLPLPMFNDPFVKLIIKEGGIDILAKKTGQSLDALTTTFVQLRYKYDFEFWAVTCVKIRDKKTAQSVPFKLRPAQLKLLTELERLRNEGIPIRVV